MGVGISPTVVGLLKPWLDDFPDATGNVRSASWVISGFATPVLYCECTILFTPANKSDLIHGVPFLFTVALFTVEIPGSGTN